MDILSTISQNPELADKITVNLKANDFLSFAKELAERLKPEPSTILPEEKYLTADEVANKLGVTRVTLWQWNKKEILKPLKIGNVLRYRQSDIDAAFKS
jgi:predicted DNA-binding transcriptional regulator AlpA